VTDDLKTYLINNFHLPSDKIEVNHCIAGSGFKYTKEGRNLLRLELGVSEDDTLFIFSSGSIQKWQNDEFIAMQLAKQGYKVLMLTKKYYEHENIITRFVPQNKVSNYLNAADIGIILRNDDIVNQVASPIKFSEYLACGLPIVSNRSVKLIEKIIQENSCGIILDSLKDLNQSVIDSLLLLDREKISLLGREEFGIEKISINYINLYSKSLEYKS
jgi:glycosyltransferase involved in cell wall biosynthesis